MKRNKLANIFPLKRITLLIVAVITSSCSPKLEYNSASSIFSSTIDSLFISAETQADGSGSKLSEIVLINSLSLTHDIFAISRDESGNFISNDVVLWSQEGNSGNLLMLDGGKAARFIPTQNGLTKITLYTDKKSHSITFNVTLPDVPEANDIPTFNFTTPSLSSNSAYEKSSFSISWEDSDTNDNANIDLYYHTSSGGNCSVGTSITSSISEDDNTDSYVFNLNSISPGTYYICAHISDDESDVYEWSATPLTVIDNISPTIAFSSPTASQEIISGNNLSITWTDTDPEDDNSIELFLTTSSSGACSGSSLTTTSNTNPIDTYSLDTSALASNQYYICASLDDGINSPVYTYSPAFIVSRVCSWTGATIDMLSPANYNNCNGVAPTQFDYILFPSAVTPVPTVTADLSIRGFYAGGAQKLVTINSGASLFLNGRDQFQSGVTFQGASSTCTDCEIFFNQDSYIVNGSTLRIEGGITLRSARHGLSVGDGTTHGHLVIDGGASKGEWVKIRNGYPWGFRSINIEGTASNNSTISIDGLDKISYQAQSSTSNDGFNFINYYEILKMDNIDFNASFYVSRSNEFTFQNCSNGIFTDSDFSNLYFSNHYVRDIVSRNIEMNATNCTSLPGGTNITMTNASGYGYGSLFEDDPNNLVTWFNETAYECEWTGAVDSSWDNPSNWNNCTNSRYNYPDQFDSVVIPSTAPRFPSLDKPYVAFDISNSTLSGGGTVTLQEDSSLWLVDGYIKEDITINAYADTCSNCTFGGEEGHIVDGATLTIGPAVGIRSNSSTSFMNVGNSTSVGHLIIDSQTSDKSKWAYTKTNNYYAGGFKIEGPNTSQRSSVNINGLKIDMIHSRTQFDFVGNYDIQKFDNISFLSAFSWDMNTTRVLFNNCGSSLFTDTDFNGLGFNSPPQDPFTTNYNISFAGCSSYPASIEVYPITGDSNVGYGSAYSNDIGGVLNWN